MTTSPWRPAVLGHLLEAARDARHVHGEDGLGDLDWPTSTRRPDPRPAVELLRDVIRDAPEPVTLVTLAPLTNIALLLRTYPDVAAGLRDIVVMGGAANVGNATASAEFNVFHDPEAAAIVLDAAADLRLGVTLYGLDVFYQPTVTSAQARRLAAAADPAARLAGLLIGFQCERFGDPATIGDAGAVCAVLDPERPADRAAAGPRRARRVVVAGPDRRRPAQLGPRPESRPARPLPGGGGRGPRRRRTPVCGAVARHGRRGVRDERFGPEAALAASSEAAGWSRSQPGSRYGARFGGALERGGR